MPDDTTLAAALTRARTHATIDSKTYSELLTMSVNRFYGLAAGGTVAGIAAIHLENGRLRWPSRPILRLLGEMEDDTEGTP